MIIDPYTPNPFPQCFIPKIITIYKVPLHNCTEFVYMKPDPSCENTQSPVIVARDSFLHIWKSYEYANKPELWKNDLKLNKGNVEEAFSHGLADPVNMPIIASIIKNNLYYRDGTTRTLYLLIHNVEAFPVMCPNESIKVLKELASPSFHH